MKSSEFEEEITHINEVTRQQNIKETLIFSDQELAVSLMLLLQKPTKLRILKFLMNREFATSREVADGVNIDGGPKLSYVCIVNNLKKLAKSKILNYTRSPLDSRFTYYGLSHHFPFRRLLDRIDPKDLKKKGYCPVWDKYE